MSLLCVPRRDALSCYKSIEGRLKAPIRFADQAPLCYYFVPPLAIDRVSMAV